MGYNSRNGLEGIDSREGMLVVTAWIFLLLSVIICAATLWPVISKLWSAQPQGLEISFYNRVCLPLFALLACILAFCPWLGWKGGVRNMKKFMIVVASFVLTGCALWFTEYRQPTAFVGTAATVAAFVSIGLLFGESTIRAQRNTMVAHGVHVGLLLIVLGVAFSGPYKYEKDLTLGEGEVGILGKYQVKLEDATEGKQPGYEYLQANVVIMKGNDLVGTLEPQKRIYTKFGRQQFAEAATIFSLGDELYASLLGVDEQGKMVLKVSVNPLVNWIWIGGVLMCLFPFFSLGRGKRVV